MQILQTYLVSNMEQANPTMLLLMRFLFSSICFHHEYLLQNENARSPLRTSAVLHAATANEDVRRSACIRYPWNKTAQTPQVTGIPPHVVLQAEMEILQKKMEETKNDIIKEMGNELDRRHIGGDAYQSSRILDSVTEATERMNALLNEGERRGSSGAVSFSDDDDLPEDMFALGDNDDAPQMVDDEVEVVLPPDNDRASIRGGVAPHRFLLNWSNIRNGQIMLLPSEYKFPHLPLNNFLIMWYCGSKVEKIPPYRMLTYMDVKDIKGGKQKLCNMKKMSLYVEEAARQVGRSELVAGPEYTVPKAVTLYNAIECKFRFSNIKITKKRRFETLGWKTFYNIMAKNGSRYADEIGNTQDA